MYTASLIRRNTTGPVNSRRAYYSSTRDNGRGCEGRLSLSSLSQTPEAQDRILDQFNLSTLDDVGSLGGQEGTTFSSEILDR